jgi:hypothetical protein
MSLPLEGENMRRALLCLAIPLAIVGCSGNNATPSTPSQSSFILVSSASLNGADTSYTGACPASLKFVAVVSGRVSGSGSYRYIYDWERENGQKVATKTSAFSVTSGSAYTFGYSEPFNLTISETTAGSLRIHVTDPNDVPSQAVPFSVTCLSKSAILSQNAVTVGMSETVDLESGVVGVEPDDIWYEADSKSVWWLTPENGARLSTALTIAPGYAGCAAASYSPSRQSLNTLAMGSYLCAQTRNGHYAQIRLDQVPVPNVGGNLVLTYTTWF